MQRVTQQLSVVQYKCRCFTKYTNLRRGKSEVQLPDSSRSHVSLEENTEVNENEAFWFFWQKIKCHMNMCQLNILETLTWL